MRKEHGLKIKRIYEVASKDDGARFLVDRLRPRGLRKDKLPLDAWLKDVAPSAELRKWFGHDPAKWNEFRRRYRAELEENADACVPLLEAAEKGTVTLLFSAKDLELNQATVLKEFLEEQLHNRPS